MTAAALPRRSFCLLPLLAAQAAAASRKSKIFNAGFDAVWTAAVEVARDGFLADRASRREGKLRFRTGPLRGYRFEVALTDAGGGRTRVEVEWLANYYAVHQEEKEAWRRGDRYLLLLARRLRQVDRK
jgi:hypothetical protein